MNLTPKELIKRVRESGVLSDAKLDRFIESVPELMERSDAAELAYAFVKADRLTRFQMARIVKGHHRELVIGNIVLESRIGAGGMGTVYRARHRRMNRRVAIKILENTSTQSDVIMRRFQREVQAAARLNHPNIVTAYDADEVDGRCFMVMEYVDGVDLGTLVDNEGPFNFAKAIGSIIQAAKGLHYAHSQKIIHRDIKPGNLLIDSAGIIKILDMGLARDELLASDSQSAELQLTGEHQIVGTVDFMSPEQADDSKSVDVRTDVYSLGCTLYYLLAGSAPFYRSSIIQTLVAHRTEPIPKITEVCPNLPPEFEEILFRIMAKRPADRPGSMGELIRLLNPFDDDTDFHVAESVGFSIMDDDDSETKTFTPEELRGDPSEWTNIAKGSGFKLEPVTLPALHQPDDSESDSDVSAVPGDEDTTEPNVVPGPAIGIDLGTTFSVIAQLDGNGVPKVIPNAEGETLTPSVLLVAPDEVVVGKEAVKAMATEMISVVECAKRDLGSIEYERRILGRAFPPEVFLSWILKKLRDDAEMQIGAFQQAVITVPAYFDEIRRRATYEAGRIAGLDVLDIINEPTAAAICYGHELLQRQKGKQQSGQPLRYVVYDLGGGTFDVTVMEVSGNYYRALATDGDVRLGGRDWDERLVNFAADRFVEQASIDPRSDPNALGRLLRECEDVKRTLSARKRTTLAFDFQGHAIKLEITRAQLEAMTRDLLARTEFTVRQILADANMTWSDIDHILLVGGATRMPVVSEMLKEQSGMDPDRSLSPDESVARGAAIHAGSILQDRSGKPATFRIQNVNSHSLGVVGRSAKTKKRQTAVLIPRNSALPAEATKVFRTGKQGQNSVLVKIVEGESPDPDQCAQVGRCVVHGLPPDLPPRSPIKVTFAYDESGRLDVDVEVHHTKLKQKIERYNGLSDKQFAYWQNWLATGELEIDEDQLLDFASDF